jgi:hypothetical protein
MESINDPMNEKQVSEAGDRRSAANFEKTSDMLNGNEKAFVDMHGGIPPDDDDVSKSPMLTEKERIQLGGEKNANGLPALGLVLSASICPSPSGESTGQPFQETLDRHGTRLCTRVWFGR